MRYLTQTLDDLAESDPQAVWVEVPKKSGDEWCQITFADLARAVDCTAHWLDSVLPPADEDGMIAYTGIGDTRWPIVMLAATKSGRTSLLSSPRNSSEANCHLLESTSCNTFICSQGFEDQIKKVKESRLDLSIHILPEVNEIIKQFSQKGRYPGRPIENPQDVACIIHSSGSTGLPKPVSIRIGIVAELEDAEESDRPEQSTILAEVFKPRLMLSTLPWFHSLALKMLTRSIYHKAPLLLLSPYAPPTADAVLEALKKKKPAVAICPPSILQDICDIPEGLDVLADLELMVYGGAPLGRTYGDRISERVHLQSEIGSTECFGYPSYIAQDRHDWDCFEWTPAANIVMEPTAEFHEVVFKKQGDKGRGVFTNFPDLKEYHTKDLFKKHPNKPNLWRYVGRMDDILVLSNGEKFNPTSFEAKIQESPLVKTALVFGSGKFQTGLLVEPQDPEQATDTDTFITRIKPDVEKANKDSPRYAQVHPSMIMVAKEEKPFARTAKASIMRQAIYRDYETQINNLYDDPDRAEQNGGDQEVNGNGQKSDATVCVREALKATLEQWNDDLTNDTNILNLGVDSLQIIQLSRAISRALQKVGLGKKNIAPRVIYQNPSVDRLCKTLFEGEASSGGDSLQKAPARSREEEMSTMIYGHTRSLQALKTQGPSRNVNGTSETSQRHVVLVTGSTGSLGSYLLHELLRSSQVDHVFCLNRTKDAQDRQAKSFRERDLNSSPADDRQKVTFLTGKLHEDNLGLSAEDYDMLREQVTTIIHNAWPVNFNQQLDFFEEPVKGTRNLADLAATCSQRAHLLFVSSIASVGNWMAVRSLEDSHKNSNNYPKEIVIPEFFEEDLCLPLKQGYGESKHVASCVVAQAARASGFRATVVRVGQIAGAKDSRSSWSKSEWFPSLIQSSLALGKIPDSLGSHNTIDFVPGDIAARVLSDLALRGPEDPADARGSRMSSLDCFNLVNPETTTWSALYPAVQRYVQHSKSDRKELATVPLKDWVEAITNLDATDENLEQYPAIKLIDFYQSLADAGGPELTFGTTEATRVSDNLKNLEAIDIELMRCWLDDWDF